MLLTISLSSEDGLVQLFLTIDIDRAIFEKAYNHSTNWKALGEIRFSFR